MLDRRISRQDANCEVLADILDPAAVADGPQSERNRFIEAFGGYLGSMLDSFASRIVTVTVL